MERTEKLPWLVEEAESQYILNIRRSRLYYQYSEIKITIENGRGDGHGERMVKEKQKKR